MHFCEIRRIFIVYKKQFFHGRILLHILTISVFHSHTFKLLTVYNLCIFNKLLNVDIWLKAKKQNAYSAFFHQSFCYRDKSTTVSTWHDTFWLMSGIVPVRGNISCQNGNMSTPSEIAHSQLQTDAICDKIDIHITVLTIEVYGNKSA